MAKDNVPSNEMSDFLFQVDFEFYPDGEAMEFLEYSDVSRITEFLEGHYWALSSNGGLANMHIKELVHGFLRIDLSDRGTLLSLRQAVSTNNIGMLQSIPRFRILTLRVFPGGDSYDGVPPDTYTFVVEGGMFICRELRYGLARWKNFDSVLMSQVKSLQEKLPDL